MPSAGSDGRSNWAAVFSLTLGVFALVTAEMLPASLLTPMAEGLGLSEALAGQAVSATAIVALFAALLCGAVTRGLDRRPVLMGFSALLVASDLLVAVAPSLPLLMLARALLGVALGGFWSMATATALRLVPRAMVPRALSLMFSGLSAAAVVAAPLGSYLGGLFGWRHVFDFAAGLGVATLVFQIATLPRLPSLAYARAAAPLHILRRGGVAVGTLCILLVFSAHFGLFTYIRPFLERGLGANSDSIAIALLSFGVANFIGTLLAGRLIEWSLRLTSSLMPLVIAAFALSSPWASSTTVIPVALVAAWGFAYGVIPVAWSTWMAMSAPDDTEAGGGLMVATVQLAIALGAAGGGLIDALAGVSGVFVAGGLLMLAAAGLSVCASLRTGPPEPPTRALEGAGR